MNQLAPNAHKERSHKPFGGSNAGIWVHCPSSASLSKRLPASPSSEAALEGTHAHEILEAALTTGGLPHGLDDREMQRAVQTALDYVDSILKMCPRAEVYSEIELDYADDCGGTFDILIYDRATGFVWVIDFKYGKRPVYPRENAQLLTYAVFARKAFELPRVNQFVLVIIQPRRFDGGNAVMEWSCSPEAVDEWQGKMDVALANPYRLNPSPERCKDCRSAILCDAIRPPAALPPVPAELARLGAKKSRKKDAAPVPFDPKSLDPYVLRQAAEALNGLPALESYCASVRKVCDELALVHGCELPGFKVVFKKARAQWDGDPDYIEKELWRIARVSSEVTRPKGLISITEASEHVKAWLDEDPDEDKEKTLLEFHKLIKREPSENRELVPETDERPATSTELKQVQDAETL